MVLVNPQWRFNLAGYFTASKSSPIEGYVEFKDCVIQVASSEHILSYVK